jgi:hypothetical protein
MSLYQSLEQSDVFVDACASDQHAQLLFLSVYGRDTSVQQLMARLHQPVSQGGVDTLTLRLPTEKFEALKVQIGDARRLEKVTGRIPKAGLLGNLVHAWIFDPKILQVDHAARTAWLFDKLPDKPGPGMETSPAEHTQQTWPLVKELSPVPLMETWQETVLQHLLRVNAICRTPAVGPILVQRVELPELFAEWVSNSVREGALALPREFDPQADLFRLAGADELSLA